MKKIIGLFLVALLGSAPVFAQDGNSKGRQSQHRGAQRFEQMAKDLNLDDKQKEEFQKVNQKYFEKFQKEREEMKNDREKQRKDMQAMREERNADIKKILTDEQYRAFIEKQKTDEKRMKEGMDKRKSDKSNKRKD